MKFPLIILGCASLIMSGTALSGEIRINQTFSGVNHPTMVDTNGDGETANAGSFQMTGSPGKGTAVSLAEFTPFAPTSTPGCELRAELVQESFVSTFNDGSMLFFHVAAAHNCVNIATFEIGGQMSGWITGGTGRFEGATGTYIVEFEAFLVGTTQAAYTGTMTGTIVVPD